MSRRVITGETFTEESPFFVVLFGTGCRIGELIGLRWSDIDLENGVISINHNIVYCQKRYGDNKCEYQVSLPKTKAGIRIIPMLKGLAVICPVTGSCSDT